MWYWSSFSLKEDSCVNIASATWTFFFFFLCRTTQNQYPPLLSAFLPRKRTAGPHTRTDYPPPPPLLHAAAVAAAKEMMSDEIYSGRSSNYWYIDLRHAVNVILLRVFQMKEILSQRQEAKAAHQARDKNQLGNLVQCGPCDNCSTSCTREKCSRESGFVGPWCARHT